MNGGTSVSSAGQRSLGSRGVNTPGVRSNINSRFAAETTESTIANGRVVLPPSAFKSPIIPTPTSHSIYGNRMGQNYNNNGGGNAIAPPSFVYNGQGSNVPPPPPPFTHQSQPHRTSGAGANLGSSPQGAGISASWMREPASVHNESSTISSSSPPMSLGNAVHGKAQISANNGSPGHGANDSAGTSGGAAALASVGEDAVRNAATLFHAVKDLRLRLTTVNEESLERAFESHVSNVLRRLDQRLVTIADARHRRVESVMAKHGLIDASFQQLILLGSAISPALGDVVKSLRSEHSELFNEMQAISSEYVEEMATKRADVMDLEAELTQMQTEVDVLMTVSTKLDKEADDNQQLIVDLRERLRSLELEKVALVSGNGSGSSAAPASNGGKATSGPVNKSSSASRANGSNGPNASMGSTANSAALGGSLVGGAGTKQMNSEAWLLSFRQDMQKALDTPHRCRPLTLNECRDQVLQIFDLKTTANAKALKSSMVPIDTMELFTYKTMEKRYGLRSLAVEHAGALLTAVQRYTTQDFDIMLYSKMFHNEVEEEFRDVLEELKRSVVDLLRVQLMARHPSKDQTSINQMISDRVHGIISAEEWSDIIAYLYNAADSKQLGAILQQRATGTRGISNSNPGATIDDDRGSSTSGTTTRPRSASAGHAARQAAMHTSSSSSQRSGTAVASKAAGASMDRATELRRFGYTRTPAKTRSSSPSPTDSRRVVLAFQDFLRCVLDFQLRNHEAFLGRFVRIFRLADANSDGFVTTDEFYNMYTQLRMDGRDESQLNASELDDLNDDFNAILSIVDPHSSNRITFSFAAANLSRIGARLPAAPSSN